MKARLVLTLEEEPKKIIGHQYIENVAGLDDALAERILSRPPALSKQVFNIYWNPVTEEYVVIRLEGAATVQTENLKDMILVDGGVTDAKLSDDIKYWKLQRGSGDLLSLATQGNVNWTDLDCADPAFRGQGIITPNAAVGFIVQAQVYDGAGNSVQFKLRKNGETHWAQIFYCTAPVQGKTSIYMAVIAFDDDQVMEWSISGAGGSLCQVSLKLMGWIMEPG